MRDWVDGEGLISLAIPWPWLKGAGSPVEAFAKDSEVVKGLEIFGAVLEERVEGMADMN